MNLMKKFLTYKYDRGGIKLKKTEMTGIQENKNLLNILTPIRRNRI